MLRTATKPKLALSINTATQSAASASKPKLSLNIATSPSSSSFSHYARSPMSPLPTSPTAINTSFNRRATGASSYLQPPTYDYVNILGKNQSILKRESSSSSVPRKTCQIIIQPTAVHSVTPIEDVDYWYKPVGRW